MTSNSQNSSLTMNPRRKSLENPNPTQSFQRTFELSNQVSSQTVDKESLSVKPWERSRQNSTLVEPEKMVK